MEAIVNAKAYTVTKGIIEKAVIVLDKGKIISVEKDGEIPKGAAVFDAKGHSVTPGFIDVHVHAGLCDEGVSGAMNAINEDTSPVTPAIRAMDGINPSDESFANAREAGITCMQILPGSANIIGGVASVVKPKGSRVEEMLVKAHSGMKAALGENPVVWQGGKGRFPSTRMGNGACLRKALADAFDYRAQKAQSERKGEYFKKDLGMENFLPVLDRSEPMRIHSHRADDICTAIRVCEEFGVRFTIEHCTEGHLIADFLASKNITVAFGPTASTKSKQELKNKGWETALAFKKAGVPFCLITDHPVIPIENLPVAAALAIRAGLDEKTALEALTIVPARHLGLEDRMGSIEPGKDADLVVWSGDPMDVRSRPLRVCLNGEISGGAEASPEIVP